MQNENQTLNAAPEKKTFGGPGWAWLPNLFTGANLVCGFLAIVIYMIIIKSKDEDNQEKNLP